MPPVLLIRQYILSPLLQRCCGELDTIPPQCTVIKAGFMLQRDPRLIRWDRDSCRICLHRVEQ